MRTASFASHSTTTDLGLSRSDDVMFEPEEELSVTQEKINKQQDAHHKISSGYAAVLHDADAITKTCTIGMHDAMDALKVGRQIHSKDSADGKQAAERKPKKEKKEKKQKPKLRLEHLPCCMENVQLQDNLEAAEAHIRKQDKQIKDMQQKSEEKLGYLAAEIQSLKARMSSSLGPESEQVFSLRVELEMVTTRARMETEDLQKQLDMQKAKLAQLEASLSSAETEAVKSKTELAENWKSHGQAVSKLQQQLTEERALHRREVQQLSAELEETKAAAKDQGFHASDQMLANAHQDILKLEEKVLEVCCENLRADKELQAHFKTQGDLVEQCIKLHGPASNLVTLFGQPALPELSAKSAKDVSEHVQYLDQLGMRMTAIFQQLQSRVASK